MVKGIDDINWTRHDQHNFENKFKYCISLKSELIN